MSDHLKRKHFPQDFIWGTATASFQIEGAAASRGRSIWDLFCETPGNVRGGDDGKVACDHVNQLEQDLNLLQDLGVTAYRFSIAWPRLIPNGVGAVNPEGVAFYRHLFEGLARRGIKAFVTLYHWDLPEALHWQGGWLNREIIQWFDAYTDVVIGEFGDYLQHIIVINEPSVVANLGYLHGVHAPGVKDLVSFYRCVHHLNLVHGTTVEKFKRTTNAQIGSSFTHFIVKSDDQLSNQQAAQRHYDSWSACFMDPIFTGQYPESYKAWIAPHCQPGDMEKIHNPGDFAGMNHYHTHYVCMDESQPFHVTAVAARDIDAIEGKPIAQTDFHWPVVPFGFADALHDFKQRYGNLPVYVTENGCAYNDGPNKDTNEGIVDDQRRVDFLSSYIHSMQKAIEQGCNVKGYFVWSLLDNFEWAEGYQQRFGIVHVDYETQVRTRKSSFYWYQKLLQV